MSTAELKVTLGTVQVRGVPIVSEKAVYYIISLFNKFCLQNFMNYLNFNLDF